MDLPLDSASWKEVLRAIETRGGASDLPLGDQDGFPELVAPLLSVTGKTRARGNEEWVTQVKWPPELVFI